MTRYKNKIVKTLVVAAALLGVGCGGAKIGAKTSANIKKDAHGNVILSEKAKEEFTATASEFAAAEKNGWTEANCDSLAKKYAKMANEHGMPDAAFNVGVVYARCGKVAEARSAFADAMKAHAQHVPTQQRCLSFLAYLDIKEGKLSDAEDRLKKAVGLGRNTVEAVPAYTMAATILRGKAMAGDKSAWQKSQKALRTALAIDAKYMPALYQLARLYYAIAVKLKKDSYLTLATLVVDQAKKTDPEFAPIYLVLGQILLAKNELVEALKAFEAAFQKDSNFYEAYMSFGAINLNFRGYQEAKQAFEKAVALRPNSYDAHMGLGVAARGLGDYALARSEYKKASEIDKDRTDYIFNLGVLEMDYVNDGTPAGYKKAQKVFETFVAHATEEHKIDPDGKRGPLKSWVEKANDRIKNCQDAVKQIEEAERQMKELEKLAAEQKKREAEMAKLAKQAEELAKKEAEGAAVGGENVDEEAIEKELAAEEAKKEEAAAADKEAKKAAEEAKKAAEEAKKEEQKAQAEKEAVKL